MRGDNSGKSGPVRAVVLGGGPAGLTAAYELCRSGADSVVLERDDDVGGLARTCEYKGYRFDLGGHRFFTRIDRVQEMWQSILGDDFLLRPRLSRILYRNKLLHYPLRPLNVLRGLGPVACIAFLVSYVRWKLWPKRPEKTFEDWVCNRFGRSLYEAIFKTYTEKVWGVPGSEITADWAAQRIEGLSLSVVLRDAVFGPKAGNGVTTLIDSFHYPRLGPGMLWQKVAEEISGAGGEVRCGRPVVRVSWSGKRITGVTLAGADGRGETFTGSHYLSSIAMRDLIRAMDPMAPGEVVAAAECLGYRDFILVALIIDRADLFPDNWIYIHDETVRVGRIQNFKNWSPHTVPDPAKTCLGMEYFCRQGDDLWQMPDADLLALATAEVSRLGLAGAEEVVDGKVERVIHAYPVYGTGYRAHVDTVRGFLSRFENLQLIGRNGRHRYVNQDRAMVSAMLAVENVFGADHDIWCEPADGA